MPDKPLPEHVTTPLLTLVTTRSLDEDYAWVAARRQERGTAEGRSLSWLRIGVVAVFGLLATIVAVQTSRDADVQELGRAALVSRIEERRAELAEMQREARALQESNREEGLQIQALLDQQEEAVARTRRLEVPTGYAGVRGEGVRMTIDDAPGGDPDFEVRDEDLATLVDGLWEAGAEAIAVNDLRLTALTGIRNTGRAIHVGGRPLTPPYVVEAIGDNSSLQADLLQTSQGAEWFTLVNGLGFVYESENVDELHLSGAVLRALRYAVEVTADSKAGKEREVEP